MGGLAQGFVFLIPVAGAIGLFTFLAVAVWADARRQERETFYRYEFRKRLVDAGKLDASELRDLMGYEDELQQGRTRRGLIVGGLIVAGTGAGLLVGLRFIEDMDVWMVGFIPLGVGIAMLGYALFTDSPRSRANSDGR